MAAGGDTSGRRTQRRRHRLWVLAACAGLVVVPPGAGLAQQAGSPGQVAQLDPSVREPICQALRSLQGAFAGLPGFDQLVNALLQSFGCAGATPGTTTTTTVVGTTTTTTVVGTTTTTTVVGTTTTTLVPGTTTTVGTGTTMPTTSTSLPPCIPNNPSTTTIPCVSTTTTSPA